MPAKSNTAKRHRQQNHGNAPDLHRTQAPADRKLQCAPATCIGPIIAPSVAATVTESPRSSSIVKRCTPMPVSRLHREGGGECDEAPVAPHGPFGKRRIVARRNTIARVAGAARNRQRVNRQSRHRDDGCEKEVAVRHPNDSINRAVNGQNTVLANPPNNVSVVMARL